MYSRYLLWLGATLACGIVLNAALWWGFGVKQLFDASLTPGDLARLSYLPEFVAPKVTQRTLPQKMIQIDEWLSQDRPPVDWVTVGDSFSDAGAFGENPYYQDFMVTQNHWRVFHVGLFSKSLLSLGGTAEEILVLVKSGLLQQLKPKYLLFECVERNVVNEITHVNWSLPLQNREQFLQSYRTDFLQKRNRLAKAQHSFYDSISFLSPANVQYLLSKSLYKLNDRAFFRNVYKAPLTQARFTQQPKEVLFYADDLRRAQTLSANHLQELNRQLNRLAGVLKKEGVTLVFMPVPNRFTLYYDDMPAAVRARYPKAQFFQYFSALPKQYLYLDTLKLFRAYLNAHPEARDLYYSDDTHWSPKASELLPAALKTLTKTS